MSDPAPCILCGQSLWQTRLSGVLDYLTDERFDIVQCKNCGLRVTSPMPPSERIDHYYPPRYRGNRHSFTGRMRVILRRGAIESFFPKNFRGRLLDVGCGDGAFALEMKSRGWDVCATEIDAATVERLRANGIEAKLPSDAEREGFSSPFDAITCWHVMEHVERPQEVAKWVATQLKPQGVFQATVPNVGSIQARIFGRHWLHLDVPRHLYHFTPTTFNSLLTRANLTPIHKSCFALEYDWFGVIQSALNTISSRPNSLFEHLTGRTAGPNLASRMNTMVAYVLCMPLAALSLPPLVLGAAAGDGATLTITCRATKAS